MLSDERICGILARCWVALGASAVGALLTVTVPNGTDPAWVGNMAVNLLFLLFYLPMERDFDRPAARSRRL